jgi:hypothetical protein
VCWMAGHLGQASTDIRASGALGYARRNERAALKAWLLGRSA